MENSKIEWTHHTFNPWIGCTKVSPGCEHCYAEMQEAIRYGRVKWGPSGTRRRTSPTYWKSPLKWDQDARREQERKRVFCASLADVFEDRPELALWRRELLQLVDNTPSLDWLFLTKRPENVRAMLDEAQAKDGAQWLRESFVWVGTSVEDQQRAELRLPQLCETPARVRFLSCEPLLGSLNLSPWLGDVEWVIVGGESGGKARDCDLVWIREVVQQCADFNVACFVKQLGRRPVESVAGQLRPCKLKNQKGADMDEWPEDLRVRQLPQRNDPIH